MKNYLQRGMHMSQNVKASNFTGNESNFEVHKYDEKTKMYTVREPESNNILEIQDTFAEMYHHMVTADSVLD